MELAESNTVAALFCGVLAEVKCGGGGHRTNINCISRLETDRKGALWSKKEGLKNSPICSEMPPRTN